MLVTAGGIQYIVQEEMAAVKAYKGEGREVVIPGEIKIRNTTYLVTAVEPYAFYENGQVTSIRLSEGIETIGACAFARCKKLSEVVFPKSLRQIEYLAFDECEELRMLWLPGYITECSAIAFARTTLINVIAGTKTEKLLQQKKIPHLEYRLMDGAKKLVFSLWEETKNRKELCSEPKLPEGRWEAISGEDEIIQVTRLQNLFAVKEGRTPIRIQKEGHPAFGVMIEGQVCSFRLTCHMFFLMRGEKLPELGINIHPHCLVPYKITVSSKNSEILRKQEDGTLVARQEGTTKIQVILKKEDGMELMDEAFVTVEKERMLRQSF